MIRNGPAAGLLRIEKAVRVVFRPENPGREFAAKVGRA
jgi:hypothetical protein